MDLGNNFHPEAREEYLDRVRYQRDYFPDLAQEWVETAEQAYASILRNPLQPREREFGHRRAKLGKFPHYFAYVIRDEQIWIVAVGSSSQDHLYWKDRLKS